MKLERTSTQLQAIFQTASELFFQLDNEGIIVDCRAGDFSSFALSTESCVNKHFRDLLPTEAGEPFARAIEQTNQTEGVVSIEYRLPSSEGEHCLKICLVRLSESQLIAMVRDITQQNQSETKIKRQIERLAALRAIDATITSSLDLSLTLSVLLNQVTNQLGVDAANVLLFNPRSQTLEYAAGCGFRTITLRHTNLQLGEGYAGRAALERRTINIKNLNKRKTDFLRTPTFSLEGFFEYYGVPLIAKGEVKGVLEIFDRAPIKTDVEWLEFLKTLAGQAAVAIDSASLFNDLQRTNIELTMAYDATIEGWSRALELRDQETEGHTQRVTEITLQLAWDLGMSEDQLIHIRRGCLLHDIGKMGIPDSILFKSDALTDKEWEIMHQHPQSAYDLLSPIAYLSPALEIPYCHHEKWDGSGYPRHLQGEEIPLAARIFAVVDVFDALTSDRPYRPARILEEALEYIQVESGKHFDPQVVKAFLGLMVLKES